MSIQYLVKGFTQENYHGWDNDGCDQYQKFLNDYAAQGWRLHSIEERSYKELIDTKYWIVCTFEKID